ncbi:MAG: AI-2E family transporter [Anaerovorax sp.]
MTDILPEKETIASKVASIVVLTLMIITIWFMKDIALLTFIITFVFYNLICCIQKLNMKTMKVKIPNGFILTILYMVFIMVLVLIVTVVYPKLTSQIMELFEMLKNFDLNAFRNALDPRFAVVLENVDYNKYIGEASVILANGATKIGGFGVNLFLSLLLSFFLLLEKNKIQRFGKKMEHSKIAYTYSQLILFGKNFTHTFGKVMKVQVTIAFINCIISMIILTILGFPQITNLGIMIFFLGLIPVAGVIISLVPLSIIAFSTGGINQVIAVLIMVALIHTIEAYILNPKLMSSRTELPVCFVFIILLVGEHYLGVWGLLIGVPVFIFMMNALDVDFEEKNEKDGKK